MWELVHLAGRRIPDRPMGMGHLWVSIRVWLPSFFPELVSLCVTYQDCILTMTWEVLCLFFMQGRKWRWDKIHQIIKSILGASVDTSTKSPIARVWNKKGSLSVRKVVWTRTVSFYAGINSPKSTWRQFKLNFLMKYLCGDLRGMLRDFGERGKGGEERGE